MKTKMLADFQIYISVRLRATFLPMGGPEWPHKKKRRLGNERKLKAQCLVPSLLTKNSSL